MVPLGALFEKEMSKPKRQIPLLDGSSNASQDLAVMPATSIPHVPLPRETLLMS